MEAESRCPQCEARVVRCDNDVLLDLPGIDWAGEPDSACWTLMPVGTMLAVVGGPGHDGKGHRLHEHQPGEP